MPKEYLVVTTTYPTTYGCHRGMSWTRADMICRSDVDTDGPYPTYEKALQAAQSIRKNDEMFENYEDDDLWEDEDPPWDSSAAENWDNDEEKRIEIMTQEDYYIKQADEEEFLEKARSAKIFERKVELGVLAAQVKAAGRVFYSYHAQPHDIRAELEINLEAIDERKKQQKEKKESKDDEMKSTASKKAKKESSNDEATDADSIEIPPNISSVKTLMFRCGKEWGEAFAKFRRDLSEDDDEELSPERIDEDPLLRVLARATSLEELHLHHGSCRNTEITAEYVGAVVRAAPHLAKTLKVLAFIDPGMLQLEPDAVMVIQCFRALEYLDISNTFSSEHYNFDTSGYGFEGDSEEFPYDEPLMECVDGLENLKCLHLGFGDQEMRRYFHDYMLSRSALRAVTACIEDSTDGRGLVTTEEERVPYPWPDSSMKLLAEKRVLTELASDTEEKAAIRALAKDALADM